MYFTVLGRILLFTIILEVSLGGGGRLFDTGSVSPRMVLFALGLAYTLVTVLRREQIPREFVLLTGAFVALSSVSALISIVHNQSCFFALNDFKPLAYFLLLPFYAVTMRSVKDVLLVSKLVKFSAVCLAVLYLIVMAIWKLNLVTTSQMFEWLNPSHSAQAEFLFRGDSTFFFKALLYVSVGVFFYCTEKKFSNKTPALLLLLAIALTMTRGMWLSVFMVLAVWVFFCTADRLRGTMFAVGLFLVGIMGVAWITEALPSVVQSNAIRMKDLEELCKSVWSWWDVLFGRGFGAVVLGREAIEITYVDVYFKQGLLGIVFWCLPPAYLFWRLLLIRRAEFQYVARPYFMAAALVYVVSLTNPFLTNPIGMSVVMIAMVAVRVIGVADSERCSEEGHASTQHSVKDIARHFSFVGTREPL